MSGKPLPYEWHRHAVRTTASPGQLGRRELDGVLAADLRVDLPPAEEADVYSIDLTHDEITWTPEKDFLSALKKRGLYLEPIPCGGSDPIAEQREQWTDGANVFAVAPGVIIGYDRNERTADELVREIREESLGDE